MITVAVESTASVASVAVMKDREILGSRECADLRKHSETILPLLDELLDSTGIKLEEIDSFCVDIGPGSFTGVRIGTASVNAIAHSLDKPVCGIYSLDILYAQAGCPDDALVLIDAGRGKAYGCFYKAGQRAAEPVLEERSAFAEGLDASTVLIENEIPTAEGILKAQSAFGFSDGEAMPVYFAPSQAERMFEERRRGKGDK